MPTTSYWLIAVVLATPVGVLLTMTWMLLHTSTNRARLILVRRSLPAYAITCAAAYLILQASGTTAVPTHLLLGYYLGYIMATATAINLASRRIAR